MPETSGRSKSDHFLSRGVSIDLEVGRDDSRIHCFSAVRSENGDSFTFSRGNLQSALRRLDQFSAFLAIPTITSSSTTRTAASSERNSTTRSSTLS